jgi:uncharacterized protein YaaN involved in tellurite resistance
LLKKIYLYLSKNTKNIAKTNAKYDPLDPVENSDEILSSAIIALIEFFLKYHTATDRHDNIIKKPPAAL